MLCVGRVGGLTLGDLYVRSWGLDWRPLWSMVQLGDIHLLAVFMSQICQQFETVQLWKFAVCLGYFNRCFLVTGSYFWWTSSFNLCSTDVGCYCSGCLVSDVNSQWFQLNFLRKSFLQLLCSYSRQYMDMTRRAMAHFQVGWGAVHPTRLDGVLASGHGFVVAQYHW